MIIQSECDLHIGVSSADIVTTLQQQADVHVFGSRIAFVCGLLSDSVRTSFVNCFIVDFMSLYMTERSNVVNDSD